MFPELYDKLTIDGGFTTDDNTGYPVTPEGYAVSLKGYQITVERPALTRKLFGEIIGSLSSAARAINHALLVAARSADGDGYQPQPLSRVYVGGWEDGGKFYFDLSEVVSDLDTALKLGRERGQLAVYDFQAGRSIFLDAVAV